MGFRDECGVVGIFGADNAASLTYFALASLQHRGQESAGIAVCDCAGDEPENQDGNPGNKITLHKDKGLLTDVFGHHSFENLRGNLAVGHVRYATAGGRTVENAQPFMNAFKFGGIALAHNGQLVNYESLRQTLEDSGSTFSSTSDTEVILKLLARNLIALCNSGGKSRVSIAMIEQAVRATVSMIKGSYALCIMTQNALIGVRDPNGIRPLCLGHVAGGFILASESCAIDAVNGQFVRDVEPGEVVIISREGVRSIRADSKTDKQTCVFEYVYFARPDSVIDGIAVNDARMRMGEVLARESAVDADVVTGVPDSGLGAALGYSKASGIPYVTGIIKNKYIGRTFIAPTQKERENMVFVKLNAIRSDLSGKRVIVIDDSIVRGTTSRRLVEVLRRAGAKEVHFRVSSPPVKFPCHLGIDTPSKSELISSTHELEEIRREIGADTLAFISLGGMIDALHSCQKTSAADSLCGFCEGCFCGRYPV